MPIDVEIKVSDLPPSLPGREISSRATVLVMMLQQIIAEYSDNDFEISNEDDARAYILEKLEDQCQSTNPPTPPS